VERQKKFMSPPPTFSRHYFSFLVVCRKKNTEGTSPAGVTNCYEWPDLCCRARVQK
jgi:hypothetical protein